MKIFRDCLMDHLCSDTGVFAKCTWREYANLQMPGVRLRINHHQRLPTIVVDCSKFMPGMLPIKSLRMELMKENRYLYEIGRYDDALQLLRVAFEATPVTISGWYVPLCDIAAAIYYEQNDLESCQEFN